MVTIPKWVAYDIVLTTLVISPIYQPQTLQCALLQRHHFGSGKGQQGRLHATRQWGGQHHLPKKKRFGIRFI